MSASGTIKYLHKKSSTHKYVSFVFEPKTCILKEYQSIIQYTRKSILFKNVQDASQVSKLAWKKITE
jgi:hypothetical protein